ncbi:hypothetical protein K440DRAFT_678888 [Wilcoxina mikolae CBS 423.85]|nr:hypothetical protein K440DRAFT_678888 [Wilcoxina mikolae CBS 423.85]
MAIHSPLTLASKAETRSRPRIAALLSTGCCPQPSRDSLTVFQNRNATAGIQLQGIPPPAHTPTEVTSTPVAVLPGALPSTQTAAVDVAVPHNTVTTDGRIHCNCHAASSPPVFPEIPELDAVTEQPHIETTEELSTITGSTFRGSTTQSINDH